MSAKPNFEQVGEIKFSDSKSEFQRLEADEQGFMLLAEFLKKASGISLEKNPKNRSLMASRTYQLLRDHQLPTYTALYARLKKKEAQLEKDFVFSLTTNTTQFFRENGHFDFMREWLPSYYQNKIKNFSREMRVWCAAASSGQEPYSILMTLHEVLGDPQTQNWDLKMLATDIDLEVLQTASTATYAENLVKDVPPIVLSKYFAHLKNPKGGSNYRVRSRFRDEIRFAPFNLIQMPYRFAHKFDIIFCRNVLIYFEPAVASKVVEELVSQLKPGGLLFLGHSESGCHHSKSTKTLSHAVYERK
jgi:chemotaxis protein methyltransferase CheR